MRSYHTPGYTYIDGQKVAYKSQVYRDHQKKHRKKLQDRGRCYCGRYKEIDLSHCRHCLDRVSEYKRDKRARDNYPDAD